VPPRISGLFGPVVIGSDAINFQHTLKVYGRTLGSKRRLDDIRRFRWFTAVVLLLAAFTLGPALALAQDNIPDIPGSETARTSPPDTTPIVAEHRPNIVFILADNVGYGDIGSYGGGELRGAPTPRIDELANQGMRLTQYLVEPGCTPSRAALMTGAVLNPQRPVTKF